METNTQELSPDQEEQQKKSRETLPSDTVDAATENPAPAPKEGEDDEDEAE